MKKNFILSLIVAVFSFICFALFMAEAYYIQDKVNAFVFLTISFTYIFIFSMITAFITYKIFDKKKIFKEFSISFLIIMISLLFINVVEMCFLKSGLDIETNGILFSIVNILSTLRLTFEFSIPIYFIVILIEFVRGKLFKDKVVYEKVGC